MLRFDPSSADCQVFTFKEGLLSAIAHDLQIRVTDFTVTADEQALAPAPLVEARFSASSLRVVTALKDGTPIPNLSDKDKREIEGNIVKDVLAAARYPEIRFLGRRIDRQPGRIGIQGELTLHGVTRPLEVVFSPSGDRWVAEVPIHQPDFGIKPYSAMLGTLKIKPTVKLRFLCTLT